MDKKQKRPLLDRSAHNVNEFIRAHSKACGEDLLYRPDMGDNEGNSKKDDGKGFYPYVIEPAVVRTIKANSFPHSSFSLFRALTG